VFDVDCAAAVTFMLCIMDMFCYLTISKCNEKGENEGRRKKGYIYTKEI